MYLFFYEKNNKLNYLAVNSEQQIPRYIIFNTQTGDTDFFVSLYDMSEDVRIIFEELSIYDQNSKN